MVRRQPNKKDTEPVRSSFVNFPFDKRIRIRFQMKKDAQLRNV